MNASTNLIVTHRAEADAESDDAELAAVLEAYLAALETGCAPSAAELMAAHPRLADRLQLCLASLQFVEQAGAEVRSATLGDVAGTLTAGNQRATLGDFRLTREIGRGGMGIVYEAEQLSLGRRVAVKVLPFAAMLSPQQLARFKNESRAAASLHHPHIVPVYSVGAERGVHYYAMQLVEGESLAQAIERLRIAECGLRIETPDAGHSDSPTFSRDAEVRRSGARPADQLPIAECGLRIEGTASATPARPSEVRNPHSAIDTTPVAALSTLPDANPRDDVRTIARLGVQAAEALHFAHESGVIHRDVKPSNLLVECSHLAPRDETSATGRNATRPHHAERDDHTLKLWITDFGLARIEADPALTVSGDVVGTLRYMSPEQLRGRATMIDHRTDVYSLGVTLYELLAGAPAFAGDAEDAIRQRIANGAAPSLRSLGRTIPVDLETIVLKAMNCDVDARYPSARDLADDLQRFLDAKPIVARRPSLAERARKWSRRHAALAAGGAAALLLIAVIAAVAALLTARAYRAERHHRNQAEASLLLAAESIDRSLSRIADDRYLHGDLKQAEIMARDATEFYDQLLEHGDDPALRLRAARAHGKAAGIWSLLGRHEDALASSRRSIDLVQPHIAEPPGGADFLAARAAGYEDAGAALWGLSRVIEAQKVYLQAAADYQLLVDRVPREPLYRQGLADATLGLAVFSLATADWDAAAEHIHQADELLHRLPAAIQNSPAGLSSRTNLLAIQALAARLRGDPRGALALLDQAGPLQQESLARWAANPAAPQERYKRMLHLSETHLAAGQVVAAAEAVELLVAAFPDWQLAHVDGAEQLLRCAESPPPRLSPNPSPSRRGEQRISADEPAQQYRTRAGELLAAADVAVTRTPESLERYAQLLLCCRDESLRNPVRGRELARGLVESAPDRAGAWFTLALAHYRNGEWQAADEALEQHLRLTQDGSGNAFDWALLAMIRHQQGDRVEAVKWLRKSATITQELEAVGMNLDVTVLSLSVLFSEAEELIDPAVATSH